MKIFAAHKASTSFLWVYFLWWTWVIYDCFLQPKPAENICDFSPILILVFSPILVMAYSIAFIFKYFNSHKSVQGDYLIFTGLVQLPLLIVAGFNIIGR
jgi:hypothetical protein